MCRLAAVAGRESGGNGVNIGPVELLLIFVVQVAFVVASALLANRKGYNAAVWAVVAVFLGFIALIIVLLLPARTAPAGGSPA
jgi:uncharacterized protein (DUF983 family)